MEKEQTASGTSKPTTPNDDPNYVPAGEQEGAEQESDPKDKESDPEDKESDPKDNGANVGQARKAAVATTAAVAVGDATQRNIFPLEPHHPEHITQAFANNTIKTTKYTVIPIFLDFFLWKMLYEQFQRLANWYFLFIGCLQPIPGLSPTGKYTTLSTLVGVLLFSMCKSGYEDYQRYKKDKEVNGRKAFVLDMGAFTEHPQEGVPPCEIPEPHWKEVPYTDIKVGDVIRIMNVDNGTGTGDRDNDFPCDICVLTTSDSDGLCYVETANLDGETNLKVRRSLDQTRISVPTMDEAHTGADTTSLGRQASNSDTDGHRESFGSRRQSQESHNNDDMYKTEAEVYAEEAMKIREQALVETDDIVPLLKEKFQGLRLETEQPNNSLYTFKGNMLFSDGTGASITPDQMLYRGCMLRKVQWMIGVTIFTGAQTKVMMNARKPPHKASRVERLLNKVLLSVLILQLCMCVGGAIALSQEDKTAWYLQESETTAFAGFLGFLTMLILFNNLIPISLYVSLEFIKFFQGRLLEQDSTIYYAPKDMRANAKTTDLNEELGQVSYVFSDKTGTLTRNVMTFMKFSVGENIFGSGTTEIGKAAAKRQGKLVTDDRPKDVVESNFPFYDSKLDPSKVHMRTDAKQIQKLFEVLSVCHTVVVDAGKYEAESPDEEALVRAAGKFGFNFVNRSSTMVTVQTGTHKSPVNYELLEVIEFNSTRKRMSVIVENKKTKKVYLFTKGADNVMFARLKEDTDPKEVTFTKGALKQFGEEGLRTLVIGQKELEPDQIGPWLDEYRAAKSIIGDDNRRSELMDKLAITLEVDLTLVGATAIEDKLQLGVPQTVEALRMAGMKVWMLTGDKVETAVNIGFACALLHTNMNILMAVEGNDSAQDLKEKLLQLTTCDEAQELALTIDGDSLTTIFNDTEHGLPDLLYDVTKRCNSVICCRVSPKQKAEVVELVRIRADGAVTLSIGDGANDVPMIQAAHVGVGISGMEGQQAANAADYSIGQFRYLHRLTMIHGRVNYHRLTLVINYFFYKNALLVLTQFWFCFFNKWTGQSLYEQWTLVGYNVGFTSLPCIAVGIFDRDILNTDNLHKFPMVYDVGRNDELFNIRVFLQWIATAIMHSAVCFFCVTLGWELKMGVDGHIMALDGLGVTLYTCVIVVATCKLAIHANSYSWMQHLTLWGSILVYFAFLAVYGQFPPSISTSMYFVLQNIGFNLAPWLFFFVVTAMALSRDFLWQYVQFRLIPVRAMFLRRLIQLKDSRDAKSDTRPPRELATTFEGEGAAKAGPSGSGNETFLFTNAEIGETDINPAQDVLLQFFDADLEDKFIRGYLGNLQRYKLGLIFTLVGSVIITGVYAYSGAALLDIILWAVLAVTSLVFLILLFVFDPPKLETKDSKGKKIQINEDDEEFNQHGLKPFLHPIMCVALFINFSCMSVANLQAAALEADTHPLTYAVILLGLLTVIRPPLLHALHYVGISFVCYISWYQAMPVDAWSVPMFVLRLVELIIVSVTALVALASSEVFLRDMFISQQSVMQRRKVAALEEMRSLRLLGNVLPTAIVNEVRRNHRQLSQFSVTYPEASLLNSDIVKFTNFSSTREPHVVVEMLNHMFTKFDKWANGLGLEKIKTIGDAYICAGGIPIPDGLHREKIVAMCVSMVGSVQELCHVGIPSLKDLNIQIRVGCASGPVRAGVVGMQKVCYDIFGATADESERMESTGMPDRVQLSPAMAEYFRGSGTKKAGFAGSGNSTAFVFTIDREPHQEYGEQYFLGGDPKALVDYVLSRIHEFKESDAEVPFHDLEREDVYAFLEDENEERRLLTQLWAKFEGITSRCSLAFTENEYAEVEFREYYADIAHTHALPELYQATLMFFINTLLIGLFLEQYDHPIVFVLTFLFLMHFAALVIVKVRAFRKEVDRSHDIDDKEEFLSAEAKEKKRIENKLTRARSNLKHLIPKRKSSIAPGSVEVEELEDVKSHAPEDKQPELDSKTQQEKSDSEEEEIQQSMTIARILAAISGTIALLVPIFVIITIDNASIGTISVFMLLSSSIYVLSFLHMRILHKLVIILVYWVVASGAFFYNQGIRHRLEPINDGGDYMAIILCFCLTLLAAYNVEAAVRKAFAAAKGLVAENADVDSAVALCDKLLNNVLPRSIVRRMKLRPDRMVVDEVDDASALFIYMDGLVADGEGKDAVQTISEMNDVLFILDELCMRHRVEKIKTTPFLVVSGCPEKNPQHCEHLAGFAHDVVLNVENYNIKNRKNLRIKIGLHTGKVTAGVLGTSKFLYDVFGDTVNFASRLTSSASWNTIQLSEQSANRLQGRGNFNVRHKGMVTLKGKGTQEVYVLELENLRAIGAQGTPMLKAKKADGFGEMEILYNTVGASKNNVSGSFNNDKLSSPTKVNDDASVSSI